MGALFGKIQSGVDCSDVYIDFANAQPTAAEEATVNHATQLLQQGDQVFADFMEYKDCSDSIRRALSNPSPQNEQAAFDEVKANVALLYKIYMLTRDLANNFGQIITRLAEMDDEKSAMEENQASARIFCDILNFVLKFDEAKMRMPGLQNDFSFYRRNLLKHADEDLPVKDQAANFVSLFYAPASPMMTHLATHLAEVIRQDPAVGDKITTLLAMIANVCLHLVKTGAFEEEGVNLMCVRAMVATIVLYDHVVPEGAFCSHSGVNIKSAVMLVCKEYSEPRTLANALLYSTLHLNDDNTPSTIIEMLEALD